MSNVKAIHETIVRDIIDLAQDLKDHDEVDAWINHRNGRSFASITSKSKDLVMVFPVICSSYMSYEAAAMICKATERKACVLLDLLFTSANICDVENGEEFIRRFHTNMRMGRIGMDDFAKLMDGFVEENSTINPASGQYEEYHKIMNELKDMNFYFEESIRESSISDFKYIKNNIGENKLVSFVQEDSTSSTLADYAKAVKDRHTISANRILDTDVKKSNELAPTLLYVNYNYTTPGGNPIIAEFIAGVKAKLYVVDGEDILNRLELKHGDTNKLLNLIKVGTKELSFFRDFVFAIDRAKIDAMSQSKRGSSNKIWKVLERRATKSKIRRAFSMTNDATAITTLCITQEEVEYLKKTKYINVEDPRVICKIMDAYNMMGFVIVDEALEIAKFLYDDGEGQYEVITFANLEREQKDNTKKIVNLMSKMSR